MSGEEDYEVRYFADKNGISMGQAREFIDRCENDRDMLERAVSKVKG